MGLTVRGRPANIGAMKKHLFLPLCLMAAFAAWALPVAYAQSDDAKPAKTAKSGKSSKKKAKTEDAEDSAAGTEEADADDSAAEGKSSKAKEKKEKKTAGAVAKAFGKLKCFNGKPNSKADYYIYLESASWCGPCNQEMPKIVAAYKEMKKDGRVELVLVGHDSTVDAAKGFLKKYNAKFPGVLASDKGAKDLPGFQRADGIPHARIVDKDGKVIADGHGSLVESWKSRIPQTEE